MKEKTEIKSAKHAQAESVKLESIWSQESRVTQRTLIYIAKLLEEILKNQKKAGKPLRLRVCKLRR